MIERGFTGVATAKPRSDENARVLPFGEKLGDSGSSTDFIGMRASTLRFKTF